MSHFKLQSLSSAIIQNIEDASAGYEFTAGFELRTDGLAGTSLGTNAQYTQEMVDNSRWLRFGFTAAAQLANDVPYWTDPTPEDAANVGLFGGSHMPPGITSLYDFSANGVYNQAVETGEFSIPLPEPGKL